MRTINQSELNTIPAVFRFSANNFTHLFLPNVAATTTWETSGTTQESILQSSAKRRYIPVDRQMHFVSDQKLIADSIARLDSNTTVNASDTFAYNNLTEFKLCGMPAFCSNQASVLCHNVTLNECEECSKTGAGIFAAVCVILGLLILLGNGMVVCVIIKNRLNDGFSMMKVSLAVSDALTGNINRLTLQKTQYWKAVIFVIGECIS